MNLSKDHWQVVKLEHVTQILRQRSKGSIKRQLLLIKVRYPFGKNKKMSGIETLETVVQIGRKNLFKACLKMLSKL